VLERRAPPPFDVLIEIQNRDTFAIHPDVAEAVDSVLRGYPLPPEIRVRDESGGFHVEKAAIAPGVFATQSRSSAGRRVGNGGGPDRTAQERSLYSRQDEQTEGEGRSARYSADSFAAGTAALQTIRVYPYGVARNRLTQAAKRLGVPAMIVNEPGEAEVLVTLRSYYRNRQRTIMDAENRGMPIYVLRANTVNQMQQFLSDLFNLSTVAIDERGEEGVRRETQAAIDAVLNGERWVELQPASASIRRLQHQMARQAKLHSHSYGKEPRRRVRIFRE
jgi:hypothetical protein